MSSFESIDVYWTYELLTPEAIKDLQSSLMIIVTLRLGVF
jgi:hypothetical protein